MRIKNNINILSIVILIAFVLFSLSCGPSKRSLEYRNSQISGIADSIIIYKILDAKKHFFLVEDKWYVVPAGYYVDFIRYIDKGDSLYKEPGRWDIYVYKRKNGKYIEKYFSGAQDYWE